MSVSDHLLTLQWAQLKHDEAYHKDIVILPLAQRMKHMALHSAKYTAYFLTAGGVGCSRVCSEGSQRESFEHRGWRWSALVGFRNWPSGNCQASTTSRRRP